MSSILFGPDPEPPNPEPPTRSFFDRLPGGADAAFAASLPCSEDTFRLCYGVGKETLRDCNRFGMLRKCATQWKALQSAFFKVGDNVTMMLDGTVHTLTPPAFPGRVPNVRQAIEWDSVYTVTRVSPETMTVANHDVEFTLRRHEGNFYASTESPREFSADGYNNAFRAGGRYWNFSHKVLVFKTP